MKRSLLLLLIVVFNCCCFAQQKSDNSEQLGHLKDSIALISKKLYSSPSDSAKKYYNKQLLDLIVKILTTEGSFSYNFSGIKDIGILTSPDNMFKIYNWNIPLEDGTHEYYGYIHSKQIIVKKTGLFKKMSIEKYAIFPLKDISKNITNAEAYIGDNNRWYGMLYYNIIVKKSKNKKPFYTLLGWDGNDNFSSKKIIDVLTFDNKGIPVFGGSVFNTPKGMKKRIVFEYAANCTMSLKYNKNKDSIVFDHLVPAEPQLEGQYQYYCTDFTYDGFGFKNYKWNFGEYVRATNEKNEKDKIYRDPKDAENSIKSNEVIKRKRKTP